MTVRDMILDIIDKSGCDYVIYDDGAIECETSSGDTMYLEFDEEGKLLKIF